MSYDWKRIESFIGYGRRDAPVVFVGLEEGLSAVHELDNDLRHRGTFDAVVDLGIAHEGIKETRAFFDPLNPKCQRTWRPMCDLMLRREADGEHPTSAQRSRYQAGKLGRSNGDTLLVELLPYPNVALSHWAYEALGRFHTREEYEAALLPQRIALLAAALAASRRELIVCYGKRRWRDFKVLAAAMFPGREIQWTSHHSGQFEVAGCGETRVVLTGHFSSRLFNTDQQLARFAEVARCA